MYWGLQPLHPFVDDAVTCDSSEANRAWSSLPAEALAYSPLYRQTRLRPGPSCSKKIIFFPLCGLSLWAPAMQRWFRTMDSAPVQSHGRAEEGEISAPPLVDSTNSPYSQLSGRNETSGMTGNIMRHTADTFWRILPCLYRLFLCWLDNRQWGLTGFTFCSWGAGTAVFEYLLALIYLCLRTNTDCQWSQLST